MRPISSTDMEPDELVATYSPATQALIKTARATLRAAFPQAAESADAKARLLCYSYGPGYKGVVATLILSKSAVKIGVPYGAQLADPNGLLTGEGKVHRHIAIETPAQLKSRSLKTLLRATLTAWQARSSP